MMYTHSHLQPKRLKTRDCCLMRTTVFDKLFLAVAPPLKPGTPPQGRLTPLAHSRKPAAAASVAPVPRRRRMGPSFGAPRVADIQACELDSDALLGCPQADTKEFKRESESEGEEKEDASRRASNQLAGASPLVAKWALADGTSALRGEKMLCWRAR